jgi:hypothetical protein
MFLDILLGVCLGVFASLSRVQHIEPLYIWVGIIAALLPDIDVLYSLVRRIPIGGTALGAHRRWTHYPSLGLVLSFCVGLICGTQWGILIGTGLLWHYLHDSVGIGWGIPWLAPFRKRYYKFFSTKTGAPTKKPSIVSWSEQELADVMKKHGNPNWIRDIYLRPSKVLLFETALIILGVIILIVISIY